MDLNSLTRNADELIRKVVARYNQLYIPAGQISQIELDLMLDDMRKLYDTFKQIGQVNIAVREKILVSTETAVNEHTETPSEPETKPQTPEAPPARQPDPEPEISEEDMLEEEKPLKEFFFPMVESEPDTPEPAPEASPVVPVYSKQEDNAPQSESIAEKTIDQPATQATGIKDSSETPATLAERFGQSGKSLSETIGRVQQGYVGTRLLQPIADLTTGIGLNDKFSFISDLFENNQAAYEEAITRINKAVNADEAEWILNRYHQSHWTEKSMSVERLKEFVRRRFL